VGTLWEYIFFIDVEGHREDPAMRLALEELERNSRYVNILGSYPRAPR
jgi:chorismate mutase/prephenate dehydratase